MEALEDGALLLLCSAEEEDATAEDEVLGPMLAELAWALEPRSDEDWAAVEVAMPVNAAEALELSTEEEPPITDDAADDPVSTDVAPL